MSNNFRRNSVEFENLVGITRHMNISLIGLIDLLIGWIISLLFQLNKNWFGIWSYGERQLEQFQNFKTRIRTAERILVGVSPVSAIQVTGVFWLSLRVVSLAAVFSLVTQRSSPQGALRDETKNGCEGDYIARSPKAPGNEVDLEQYKAKF